MIKSIEITLYEVLGYLLPGTVIAMSLWVAFHALFWHDEPLIISSNLPFGSLVELALIGYLLGHIAQGIGNVLQRLPIFNASARLKLPLPVTAGIDRAIESTFGLEISALTVAQKFAVCDEFLVHAGSVGEREIYTYREGFYRGCFVAFGALAVAVLPNLVFAPISVRMTERSVLLGYGQLYCVLAASIVSAYISALRYLRFARYRIERCFLRFWAHALANRPAVGDTDVPAKVDV